MTKVIVIERFKSFFSECSVTAPDYEILGCSTNDELLVTHRKINADVIAASFSDAGMSGEELCSKIRSDRMLRRVSLILCCSTPELEHARRCRANAVIDLPSNRGLLQNRLRDFAHISRRGNYRVSFRARYSGYSLREEFWCCCQNVSSSGMLIEANADLAAGDWISCSLTLPSSICIEAQAEVVRTVKSGTEGDVHWYGIRFQQLEPSGADAIDCLVQKELGVFQRGASS